ncbi:MAG: HEAT repeat domain-containing protein [Gemmatimonadota bacterium]
MKTGHVLLALTAIFSLPRAARAQESAPSTIAPDNELKKEAIFLLANRRTPESRQALRTFYQRTTDEELKKTVIFQLAQDGSPENLQFLKSTALDEGSSAEIRKTAIFWLGQNRSIDMTELEDLYTHSDSREIKEQIIFVYSQRHETAAVDRLMTLARHDPDPDLRKKALFWLAQSHDDRVTRFLTDLVSD